MDTLIFLRPSIEKIASGATSIAILICLLMSQSMLISAKDSEIVNHATGISPSISYIKEEFIKEQEAAFEREIQHKYRRAKITDIDKGIKHVKMIRYYNGRPVRINLVELSTDINNELQVIPATASTTLASKNTISTIAKRENALVAVNGGYFKPQNGIPLGTLVINKKIYTGPIYDRVAMGISDNGYNMARVQLKANIITNIGGIKIDNINQPRMLSTHTLVYTPDWGATSPGCPKYGKALAIQDGKLIASSYGSLPIPENGFVIVGSEKNLNKIANAKKFKLEIKINPQWANVNHIISGGPYLVRNNEIYVDMTAERLAAIGGRNPRTAIGYTANNHLIMLTADGREGSSIGLTLVELANLMKEFGCINAMNLDGGGSTVMYVSGSVVNNPQVKGGIPLSHTVVISKKRYS